MRFVRPERKRIVLTDGNWIDVKARLNAGEQRAMFAAMVTNDIAVGTDGQLGGGMGIDAMNAPIAQVLAYLVDWSLTDDDGQPVAIRGESADVITGALDLLEPDDYQEIVSAIQAHDNAIRAARAQEKKLRSDATKSATTLPSLVGVAGGTNG